MTEHYEPASDFLKAIAADEIPLSGSEFAAANLQRLIEMTRDSDRSNRDWAALLLSQQEIDTPAVRQALLDAADDEDAVVRAEAILGLAQRDQTVALPLIKRELGRDSVSVPIFEAAAIVADASLAEDLRAFIEPSGNAFIDGLAADAFAVCSRNG